MGLGLAALRDVSVFFHNAAKDDNGTANPLAGQIAHTILRGDSQSGRLLRTFLDLGFNEDESGHQVFEGMHPHIGSVRNYINVRFSQPAGWPGLSTPRSNIPVPTRLGPMSPLSIPSRAKPAASSIAAGTPIRAPRSFTL
jgi:Alpha/beta hydrolase domain